MKPTPDYIGSSTTQGFARVVRWILIGQSECSDGNDMEVFVNKDRQVGSRDIPEV